MHSFDKVLRFLEMLYFPKILGFSNRMRSSDKKLRFLEMLYFPRIWGFRAQMHSSDKISAFVPKTQKCCIFPGFFVFLWDAFVRQRWFSRNAVFSKDFWFFE